jgi:Protein of unknown function (DUF4012)
MDERYGRTPQPDGSRHARDDEQARRNASPSTRSPGRSEPAGGLLTRSPALSGGNGRHAPGARMTNRPGSHGANRSAAPGGRPAGLPASPPGRARANGLLSRAREFGETVLRATVMRGRLPQAGDWRASDFSDEQLENWDRRDAAPFDLPPDPDAPLRRPDARAAGRPSDGRPSDGRRQGRQGWDDDLDAAWETGTWDTGWATGDRRSLDYGRSSHEDSGFWRHGRGGGPPGTVAMLAAPRPTIRRRERIRLLMQRRPAAAALLLFMLAGFLLTAIAPMIPLLRLGYDAADLAYRVSALQSMVAGGTSALFNTSKLREAQDHIDSIQRDLFEINGAINVVGGPLGAVSSTARNYRLLINIGYDLTAAGDEGLQVAQTLLTPLAGGALSADPSTPGITAADIQQAHAILADAQARVLDAVAVYRQLDPSALPAQLRPGSKYGQYLALLPLAPNALVELNSLLDAAPAMLGVGDPAYYLVLAMDRTELRAGGGFMGNYGLLELDGGKQSKDRPLALGDTYTIDEQYFRATNPYVDVRSKCVGNGPKPPELYWWWPYRELGNCSFNWGLRDSNLSPDFPSNARVAIDITETAHGVPNDKPIQGVVAFTPVLIADLLAATGPLDIPQFQAHVTADNLETTIHDYQLGGKTPPGVDRKEFTHQLSTLLLDRLKHLPKDQLKSVLGIVEGALKHKDLQIYLSDPRAELILQHLGLASQVSRGEGDGFFVVDTNDGGNKANLYVTEHQTDFVTLLPNGGALHRLQVAVTYDKPVTKIVNGVKEGWVYDPGSSFDDYSDLQRTYLPGDATIFGYTGFNALGWYPDACAGDNFTYYSLITACGKQHMVRPSTSSDVSGRTMVMGPLLIWCGPAAYSNVTDDYSACENHPVKRTQTVYIEWYTPHAFNRGPDGHGTYTELIEKQSGTTVYKDGAPNSLVALTVYVSTAALSGGQSLPGDTADQIITATSPTARDSAFARLLLGTGVQKIFDGPLMTDTPVSVSF